MNKILKPKTQEEINEILNELSILDRFEIIFKYEIQKNFSYENINRILYKFEGQIRFNISHVNYDNGFIEYIDAHNRILTGKKEIIIDVMDNIGNSLTLKLIDGIDGFCETTNKSYVINTNRFIKI